MKHFWSETSHKLAKKNFTLVPFISFCTIASYVYENKTFYEISSHKKWNDFNICLWTVFTKYKKSISKYFFFGFILFWRKQLVFLGNSFKPVILVWLQHNILIAVRHFIPIQIFHLKYIWFYRKLRYFWGRCPTVCATHIYLPFL